MPSSDSGAIQKHNHKIYNGSGKISWIFFLSHINGYLSMRAGCQMFGTYRNVPIPSHGVSYTSLSMMDCIQRRGRHHPTGLGAEDGLQKGGCAGSWRRAVIGLGLILGPIPKEVWTGKYARLATRIRSLMGKAAHLCRV